MSHISCICYRKRDQQKMELPNSVVPKGAETTPPVVLTRGVVAKGGGVPPTSMRARQPTNQRRPVGGAISLRALGQARRQIVALRARTPPGTPHKACQCKSIKRGHMGRLCCWLLVANYCCGHYCSGAASVFVVANRVADAVSKLFTSTSCPCGAARRWHLPGLLPQRRRPSQKKGARPGRDWPQAP